MSNESKKMPLLPSNFEQAEEMIIFLEIQKRQVNNKIFEAEKGIEIFKREIEDIDFQIELIQSRKSTFSPEMK